MAAEIVVIVKNENARPLAGGLAIEMRRGEAADAASDDNEVVVFLDCRAVERKFLAITQVMRDLERARMVAAQAA